MHSSNLPPQTATDSSRVNVTESATADAKQQAITRIGQVLQPVSPSAIPVSTTPAGQGNAGKTAPAVGANVYSTANQQLVQITPAVRITGAESLLLVRLPTEAPIQPPQGGPVSLKSMLPPESGPADLPALLKLSPQTIRQQVTQAQFQTLMTVLSQTLSTPVTLPATVIQQDSTLIRVNAGTERPLIIDIPLNKNTRQPESALSADVKGKPPLPTTVSITVSLRHNQLQVQITPRPQSAPTLPTTEPNQGINNAANPLRTISVPVSSPVANKLTQAVSQQLPLMTEPMKLANWAKQALSPLATKTIEQLSPLSPAIVNIKGNEVTITGSKTQLLAVNTPSNTTSTAALNQMAPRVTTQQINQLNMQSVTAKSVPQFTITPLQSQSDTASYSPSQALQQSGDKPANAKADVAQPLLSPFQALRAENAVGKSTIPTEIENIAKFKVEQLPVEVKTALEQFIRSAKRINLSNTEPLQSSLSVLTSALQKFASANPSLLKNIHSVIEQLQLHMPAASRTTTAEMPLAKTESGQQPDTISTKPAADTAQAGRALQQLMTSPAWLQSPLTLSSPPAGQSFLSGLIQLLQVSLLGRHFKNVEDIDQALHRQRASSSKGSAPAGLLGAITGRQVREFAQLDSQQNLLKQLKGLLAGHQGAKLGNMEQALQGQDSFYYVLPGLMPQQKPAELLIRRERERQPEQENQSTQTQWHLTMKLDIGEQGELLTKARIKDEQLYLDIYSSNQSLLEKVGVTLPFLLKRFKQLGLTVEEHKLQLGKIPETLATRPYQILETQA